MKHSGAEDRLNPVPPQGADESTLGGYAAIHGRAAAFEGKDGEPYTVGMETDDSGDPRLPVAGYLVFVRWARTGTAIMGHLSTGDLLHGRDEGEVRRKLEELPLPRVRALLDGAIDRSREEAEAP